MGIDIAATTTSGTQALCATINTSPAVALAAEGGSVNLDFSDCGDASTIGTITDLQPRQLPLGGTTTLVGSGTLDGEFPAGEFTFNAKALGVSILQSSGDVCSPSDIQLPLGVGTFSYKGNTCPIAAGPVDLTFDVSLSSAIPSQIAKLEIDIAATTTSGTKALCATINTSPAVALAVEGGNVNLDFSDCGDASTIGVIKDVQPRQLALGGTTTLVGSGTLSAEFPAGDFTFNAKALGVTVLSDGGDVCAPKDIQLPLGTGTFSYKGNSCPLAAGDVALTFDATLSSAIPSQIARLEIDIAATTSSGTKALCATINTSPAVILV